MNGWRVDAEARAEHLARARPPLRSRPPPRRLSSLSKGIYPVYGIDRHYWEKRGRSSEGCAPARGSSNERRTTTARPAYRPLARSEQRTSRRPCARARPNIVAETPESGGASMRRVSRAGNQNECSTVKGVPGVSLALEPVPRAQRCASDTIRRQRDTPNERSNTSRTVPVPSAAQGRRSRSNARGVCPHNLASGLDRRARGGPDRAIRPHPRGER